MGTRKEYIDTLTLTKDELYKARRAQAEIRQDGFSQPDESKLVEGLTAFATVLSLMFKLPTPVTLAAGVISAVGGMLPSEIDTLTTVSIMGEDFLDEVYDFLYDNPEYDLVEVKLPFLEFIDEGFRIVQGEGIVTKVHAGSGWILL
ncbi:hypothetical protein [Paramaledivibacter caminithermalis]|jgi:hypothetical protein|uniref:Uncharacterized protein n=1 Tax=Paramaledivibacter caminithermalis (strain DSM 15212 / CIP 107654 / DViRD3) TaxID=1121301 RepID=A0A1M6TX25_PARC5|nr:hypothetical protein [Paramaledivibacter caminithermalis]SHK61471.1 hypothetical protein SAMN02745912_03817 [Paramaledivibacter caminithermalis DSM 15212]